MHILLILSSIVLFMVGSCCFVMGLGSRGWPRLLGFAVWIIAWFAASWIAIGLLFQRPKAPPCKDPVSIDGTWSAKAWQGIKANERAAE